MGRKKVIKSAERNNMQMTSRIEMNNVLKQLEAYHPFLRELVILGQHLWVTSDQWMLTADALKDESGALARLNDLASLRQFHTDMIMAENRLERLQQKTFELRKKLKNFADPMAAMGEFIETILPSVMEMQLDVAEKTRSLKCIDDKYNPAIKNISVQLAGSLHDLMANLEGHIAALKSVAADQPVVPENVMDDCFTPDAAADESVPVIDDGTVEAATEPTPDEEVRGTAGGNIATMDEAAFIAASTAAPTTPATTE
jgi:hypothetical protein